MVRKFNYLVLFVAMVCMATSCGFKAQSVKPYEIGKVTAETILFDARVLQNKGIITADQFDKVRGVYDKLAKAQDIAIDARKVYIAFNTPDSKRKAEDTFFEVLKLSSQLINLAQNLGVLKGE